VGAETPDAAYRDALREGLNSFAAKQNELRAQGMSNREIIDMMMRRAKEAHENGVKLEDELQKKDPSVK